MRQTLDELGPRQLISDCYLKRQEAFRPTGFYRDYLRTCARILSRLAWQELLDSLSRVATDVDGQGPDLGVFCSWRTCLISGMAVACSCSCRPSSAGHLRGRGSRLRTVIAADGTLVLLSWMAISSPAKINFKYVMQVGG